MKIIIKLILAILFLPILLTVDVFKSRRGLGKKFLLLFVVFIFFLVTWIGGYVNLVAATDIILYQTGITDKLVNTHVSGTSMLPTLQDGQFITLHNPKKYGIERGDIVTFSNVETSGLSYIKRVVGMSGDTISLKDGKLFLNGKLLQEDYVNNDEPTYGNTFLTDCETYTVPKGKVAVFGDNRIASTDSRVIGFVNTNDIDGVIKTHVKPQILPNSTLNDLNKQTLNTAAFINDLNQKRSEKNVAGLHLNDTLTEIASAEAVFVSKNIDNWKDKELPIGTRLEDKNYDYTLVQEVITMGNYNADQLTQHVLELYPYNQDFLSSEYYEIGVATSQTTQGQCTIPVIVIVLTWPTKPSISQDIIQSWDNDINMLSTLITNVKKLKDNPNINRADTDKLITDLSTLLEEANNIKSIYLSGRWPTQDELNTIDDYHTRYTSTQKELGDYVRKNLQFIQDTDIKSYLTNFRWGNAEFNKEADNAKTLFSQGKYQDQLASANKMLNLAQYDDEKSVAYYWQGLAYYYLQQNDKARNSLSLSIKLDETNVGPYSTMAALDNVEGKYQEALQYATKCAQVDPTYGWCYNNLGLAYANLGQKDKAVTALEKAVTTDPTNYTFNDNLKRIKAL